MPAKAAPAMKASSTKQGKKSEYQDKEKPAAIRLSNVSAAKGGLSIIYVYNGWNSLNMLLLC